MSPTEALAELRSVGCPAYLWRGNPSRGHVDRVHAGGRSHGVRGGEIPDGWVWMAVREWVRSRRQWRDTPEVKTWEPPRTDNWRASVRYPRSRYR